MIFMAKQLSEAEGFVPAHFFRQPSKILAAMLYGRDLGITPTNALQHIIVIDGKATADAQLMGMLVRRAGHRLEDLTTDQSSTVTITRGDDASVHKFTFSMQDAQRAGLLRQASAWQKYPQAMLYARALSGAARKAAQDALMGCAYTPEELDGALEPTGEIGILEAAPQTRIALEAALKAAEALPPQVVPAATSEAQPAPQDSGSGSTLPQAAGGVGSLSGASVSRRLGAGRSIGPAPKRVNTVTMTPQTAENPAPAAERQPPAPDALTDEPAPPELDLLLQQLLRESAAKLTRVNRIYTNKLVNAPNGKNAEPLTPQEPNPTSDESLRLFLATASQNWPGGKTLTTLTPEEAQRALEVMEGSLLRKRAVMKQKGVSED
jgi:hypothetical protein